MNAVILAGGFGSRLKPLTDSVPKPMLPIANAPMLDYVIAHLCNFGIKDIVLTLGYFPETIEAWLSGYSGIKTKTVTEDIPLGTAGGVKAASEFLDDSFFVLSGDALENIDFAAMARNHEKSGKLVTMAVTKVSDARQFGLVQYDEFGTVTAFTEKSADAIDGGIVNCGVYLIKRAALRHIPIGEKYDFSYDLFPRLLNLGQINAYFHDGYWSDIGSPISYYNANFEMLSAPFYPFANNRFRPVSHKLGAEKNTLAAYSSLVSGSCNHSIVGQGAAITSNASVDNCVVLPDVTVNGYHYGEIIGNGYCLPIAGEPARNLHDSTQIYKNFS